MKLSHILDSQWMKVTVAMLLVVSVCVKFYFFAVTLFLHKFNIYELSTQEFFINFSGGFVRRGLLGELLLRFINLTQLDFQAVVLAISTVCYLAFTGWMMKSMKRNGVWLWLALMPLMCGELVFVVRKDYLQLLLMIPILKLCVEDKISNWKVLWITLLCLLEIMLHEAFIFWGAPIPIICLTLNSKKRSVGILGGLAVISSFLICCVFKGDSNITRSIAASWEAILGPIDGKGLGGLDWKLGETVRTHLKLNFYHERTGYWLIAIRLAGYLMATYLVTFAPALFNKDKSMTKELSKRILTIWIILSVCMLPMFTILSCDYSRLYLYLSATTYATVFILPATALAPVTDRIKSFSTGLINRGYRALRPALMTSVTIALLLCFAVTPWRFSLRGALEQSVIGGILTYAKELPL